MGGRAVIKDYVQLVRAPAALTVPGDVIAGGGWNPTASTCLYWAGMAAALTLLGQNRLVLHDPTEGGLPGSSHLLVLRQVLPVALTAAYVGSVGRAQARAFWSPDAQTVCKATGAGILGLPLLQGALSAKRASLAAVTLATVPILARKLSRKVSRHERIGQA